MVIVMVGGSGGLGRYLCEALAGDGQIIATYYSGAPPTAHENVEWHQVDVCDASSVKQFAAATAARLERVVLINLAAISLDGIGHKMSDAHWDRVLDTNLRGSFLTCREFLPLMRQQEWGRIINVSSIVGQTGVAGTSAYAASKAGIFGLTRTLAVENAPKNITVNALALGYFEVGLITALSAEMQERVKAGIPMKRLGHPRNVAAAVRFLIESDYVTGSVIDINGGLR